MLVIASLVVAAVISLVALIAYAKWRSFAATVIVAAVMAGTAAAGILRGDGRVVRWAGVVMAAGATALVSFSLMRSYPPSSDELVAATRLVHDGPLRASRGVNFAGYSRDKGFFCIIPCEERAEQSDSVAGVQQTAADIVERLEDKGYETRTERAEGLFVSFEPTPGQTTVIHAERRSITLRISVAPTESGSVVASHAE